jgi:hypothetical protein
MTLLYLACSSENLAVRNLNILRFRSDCLKRTGWKDTVVNADLTDDTTHYSDFQGFPSQQGTSLPIAFPDSSINQSNPVHDAVGRDLQHGVQTVGCYGHSNTKMPLLTGYQLIEVSFTVLLGHLTLKKQLV